MNIQNNDWWRRRKWQIFLPAVAALMMAIQYGVCTQDDAFISFRYAQNWADGLGWVFNEGERVEGFSNPLWTFLFGLVCWVGWDPVLFSLFMGYLSVVLFVWSTHSLFEMFNIPPQLTWLCVGAVALDPSLTLESVQGLESVFYAALVTTFVTTGLKEYTERSAYTKSLLVAIILCAFRPEAPLFVFFLYGSLWFMDNDWKKIIIPLATIAVWLIIMTTVRWYYYGDVLPNTFYAKVGGWAGTRGLQYCWLHLRYHPLVWIGLIGGWFLPDKRIRTILLVLVPYILYVVSIGGDFKPTSRFLITIGGLGTVITAATIQYWTNRNNDGFILIFGVIILTIIRWPLWENSQIWAADRRGNLLARKVVGEWIDDQTPRDTVIAMHSIGVVPFYANRKTIDMWGLTNRTIAQTPAEHFGEGMAGHEKTNPEYVFSLNPDIYLPEDGFFQPSKIQQQYEESLPSDFEERYSPVSIQIKGSWLNIWVHKNFYPPNRQQ